MRAADPEAALRDLVAAAEDRQSTGVSTGALPTMTSVQIKICGVTNVKDAESMRSNLACQHDWVQLLRRKVHVTLSREVARRIIEAIPPGVCRGRSFRGRQRRRNSEYRRRSECSMRAITRTHLTGYMPRISSVNFV